VNLRARLLLSGILAVLVIASGAVVQARLGVRQVVVEPSGEVFSGAWFCPHGGLWRTWITLGNPGEETSTVRATTFGDDGITQRETFDLPGGATRYLEVPTESAAAGTMVEFFGEPVAAGWVSQDEAGVASESCRSSAGRSWFAADGDTLEGHDSWLMVMNPFAEDAAFDVTLVTTEGAPTRVGSLRGYVLKGRQSVVFRLNRYLLDEPSVGAIVSVALGSVSVGELGAIEGVGIRAITAVPHPARRWVLPAALAEPDSTVVVQGSGEDSAAFSVRQLTEGEQRPVEALTDVSLRGLSIRRFATGTAEGVSGLVVDATGDVPVVAARRTFSGGDVGAMSGASTTAASWVVSPTVPPTGGRQNLLLQNAGLEDVTVRVRLFGEAAEDLGEWLVPAGRTIVVPYAERPSAPAWASVVALEGTIVAGSASVSLGGDGYAVAMGLPLGPVSRGT
jgi:hypothetical protein